MRKGGNIHKCLFLLHLKGIAKIAGMVIMLLSIGKPKFIGAGRRAFFSGEDLMETTTQAQSGINLFGEETLSMEQIKKLSERGSFERGKPAGICGAG